MRFWIKDVFGAKWRTPGYRHQAATKARWELLRALQPFALVTWGIVLAKVVGL